ncbi:hypothetical protein [Alkalimonas mucilaginosa]|uniref:TolB protein n=1 Tax=Alkalimonas mucilaginosa TaxID=3057676 RepID=A0ABU7JJ79_9GAMM|nr:hypothetical protein [Alkalimonas sp. MEB004]MEE2025754.1 hypothetical protein [Alkalimonas sp. MEB004]
MLRYFVFLSLSAGLMPCCALSSEVPALEHPVAFISLRHEHVQIFTTQGIGKEQALTKGQYNDMQPVWSPDGSHIAFSSVRDGVSAIYLLDLAQQATSRLHATLDWQSSPSWSPDGRTIAFITSTPDQPGAAIHAVDIASGRLTVLAQDGYDKGPGAPVWSNDGKYLAFVGGHQDSRSSEIWLVASDGSGLTSISTTVSSRKKAQPALSPDGRYLAFIADMRGYSALMKADLVTGDVINLTFEYPAAYETPRWSSDGSMLAFASSRDDPDKTRMDIFVMNVDGTAVRNLTQHPGEDFNPQWMPDNQTIVFMSLRTGTAQLWAVHLPSQQSVRLTNNQFHDMDQVPQPASVLFLHTAASDLHGVMRHETD